MRQQGRIVEWDDERGFGFVESHDGGARAFVHISAFGAGARRPVVGDLVTYSIARDDKRRLQARGARHVGKAHAGAGAAEAGRVSPLPIWLLIGYMAVLFGSVITDRLPFAIPLLVFLVSLVTFITYGIDKRASRKGSWRTSEATLHFLALLGGWPGALLAQRRLRHKIRKREFQVVFWCTVVLNIALLVVLAYLF